MDMCGTAECQRATATEHAMQPQRGTATSADQRILHDLYHASGQASTAQTFVCSCPGCESIDVVNVHAPSRSIRLKDSQRQTLLTELLQSNSQARPGRTIGNAHFLIGGDMNTAPFLMARCAQWIADDCYRASLVMHTDAASLSDFLTLLQRMCLCVYAQLWMDRVRAMNNKTSLPFNASISSYIGCV